MLEFPANRRRQIAASVAFLLFGLHAHNASAQGLSPEVVPLEPPQVFETIGVQEGLKTGQTTSITQDGVGFLWIGTAKGLSRYDGYEVENFVGDENSKTALLASEVTAVATTSDGVLLVGTVLGLQKHKGDGTFERISLGGGEEDPAIMAMERIGDEVWMSTTDGTVLTLGKSTDKPSEVAVVDELVLSFTAGPSGVLAGGETGVYRIAKGKADKIFNTGNVRGLAVVDGKLFIGADSGLFEASPNGGDTRKTKIRAPVRTMLYDKEHEELWVGTEQGLFRMGMKTGSMARYGQDRSNSRSLQSEDLTDIYRDREGVMWFATRTGGASKFDRLRSQFELYRGPYLASGLAFGAEGRIYLGTHPGSLTVIDRKKGEMRVFREVGTEPTIDLTSEWVKTLTYTDDNTIWLGTEDAGAVRVNLTTNEATHFNPDILGISDVFSIAPGRGGDVYLGTWGKGVLWYDSANDRFVPVGEGQLSESHVYTIVQDRGNPALYWVGTAGGFDLIDTASNKTTSFPFSEEEGGLSNPSVLSIYADDREGVVWLGTYGGGLNRYDRKKNEYQLFTTEQGLAEDTVHAILPDPQGKLWLMSDTHGITRFDPKDSSTTIFTPKDGVVPEFVIGSYARNPKDELVLGGQIGLVVFKPEKIATDPYSAPLVLTKMTVGGEPFRLVDGKPAEPIETGYREASITARFASLGLSASEGSTYRYRLKGQHDDWAETKEPELQYRALSPGDYTIEIEATNRHGVKSANTITVPITVIPPLWRRWWAYAIYAGILVVIVLIYLRWQQQRLEALKVENRLAHVERDIELSATVQQGYLPAVNEFEVGQFKLAGFYQAAEACSGDWWFYERTNKNTLLVIIGDVTGHGVGPAMVTAAAGTAFRVTEGEDVEHRLEVINKEVLSVGRRAYHMTATALEVNLDTGETQMWNAGGLPVLHLTDKPKPKTLIARGSPLGSTNLQVGNRKFTLGYGERVFICTDGIPEISIGADGRQLGMRKVSSVFAKSRTGTIVDARTSMFDTAKEALGENEQDDDWTYVIVERVAGGAAVSGGGPAGGGGPSGSSEPEPVDDTDDYYDSVILDDPPTAPPTA